MSKAMILIVTVLLAKISLCQNLVVTSIERISLVQLAENKIKIIIEGHICKDIVVKAEKGIVRSNPDDCDFIYIAPDTSIHNDVLQIGLKGRKEIKWLQTTELSIQRLLDPEPSVGGYLSGSVIPKAAFIAQSGIAVPVTDGWHWVQIQKRQKILNYSVKLLRGDSTLFEKTSIKGFLFPTELKDFIRLSSQTGDKIVFYNIHTLLYETELRLLKDPYLLILN
jgi:hypothetical protein